MTTSAAIFRILQSLAPEAPLLVGRVIAIHDEDDTSSVLLPSALGTQGLGATLAAGSVIRARGTWVPVGQNAFVRRGLIENRAPDADPEQVVVGTIEPPPNYVPPVELDPLLIFDSFNGDAAQLVLDGPVELSNQGATWAQIGSTTLPSTDGDYVVL